MAHAEVVAQRLHLLRSCGELLRELVDAFDEGDLRRRELADRELALLDLGVQRGDVLVATLDIALERVDAQLVVDRLKRGLFRLLRANGIFGLELLAVLEVGRKDLLQLVVRFLAFFAPRAELGALTLELIDPISELLLLLVMSSKHRVARVDRLVRLDQGVLVVLELGI